MELFEASCEEAPGPPELFEIVPSLSVQGIHLARRPLLRRDLLHVDEAALLDPDEQRVDGALGDVGEALLPQPCRDLVAVRGLHGQDRDRKSTRLNSSHITISYAVFCLKKKKKKKKRKKKKKKNKK